MIEWWPLLFVIAMTVLLFPSDNGSYSRCEMGSCDDRACYMTDDCGGFKDNDK